MGYPKLWQTSHVLSMLSQCRRQFLCPKRWSINPLWDKRRCPSCSENPSPLWVSLQALPDGSIEDVCHGMSAKVDSELKKAFDMQKCTEFTGKHVDRAQQQ